MSDRMTVHRDGKPIYDIIMEGISGLTYHEFLEDFAAANTSYGTPEHFDPQLLKYLY